MRKYTTQFEVKWSDVDPNMHMRHTVYLDYADQTRIRFFNDHGLPFNKLQQLGIGPIIFGTQTDFKREVMLSEKVTLDCHLIELSPNGRKWIIKHYVYKEDGTVAAELTYRGAWLDLRARKVVAPPEEIAAVMNKMEKTELKEPVAG
ncbi:thioesterase family protein [Fulvivirga sp. 29W222]|uniref:Thioesterase family protein n=1 Tax=Fulvivirga marina TaxID=2494733 RepID=A0A937KCB5_9BACT|nr:acyl-CoA thioesterase [Fulvivirga marina]MBL6447199.1 thioesterase family protein [Fulvivirga marina]